MEECPTNRIDDFTSLLQVLVVAPSAVQEVPAGGGRHASVSSAAVGVALCLSFLGNGIHSSLAKLAGKSVHPTFYTLYIGCGAVLVCSFGLWIEEEQKLYVNFRGLVAGMFLAFGLSSCVYAIKTIGLAFSTVISASTASLLSFTLGKFFFHEAMKSSTLTAVGLLCLLLGIVGTSGVLRQRLHEVELSDLMPEGPEFILGVLAATVAGALIGSSFAFSSGMEREKLFAFVWCQAFFMLLTQIAMIWAETCFNISRHGLGFGDKDADDDSRSSQPGTHASNATAMSLGLTQGILVGCTNLFTALAAQSQAGLGVAVPVREAGCVLAILIGALVFAEYGKPEPAFLAKLFGTTLLTVAGCICLSS